MDIFADYLELAPVRSNMYQFLSRIYRLEVDEELLANMQQLSFPDSGQEDDFAEGCKALRSFLARPGIDPRTDLAVDYARVFLGAGIADGRAAFPYESVYTSPERLIMQEARDEVLACYVAHGLGVEGENHDPEDHVGFELDFMAHLVGEGAKAAEARDKDALVASIADQRQFLADHLLNWLPALCADVARYSSTKFYPAIAKMTIGFAQMDQGLLAELAADAEE